MKKFINTIINNLNTQSLIFCCLDIIISFIGAYIIDATKFNVLGFIFLLFGFVCLILDLFDDTIFLKFIK